MQKALFDTWLFWVVPLRITLAAKGLTKKSGCFKMGFLGSVGKAAVAVAMLIGYTRWEHPDNVEFRFGIITTVLMLSLIGAPLFSLGDIIRTKSVESLPFPLIASGTVVSFLWLLYGIIIKNIFMQVQNSVGFMLCLIQLSLFAIYPSSPPQKQEKKKN